MLWASISVAYGADAALDWRVGVLDGYQYFSVAWRSGTKSKSTDIRRLWDAGIFFRSDQQVEKQGRTYPFVGIIDAAPQRAMFLAAPGGLMYREDGPLLLGNALTGEVIATLPVSGATITAAFVPPDARQIVASWQAADGKPRTTIFDVSTGQIAGELSARPPESRGFLFADTPTGTRFIALRADQKRQYQLAALDPQQEPIALTMPAGGKYGLLDIRGSVELLDLNASLITVSCWDWSQPDKQPVVVSSSEYGQPAVHAVLADRGRRVMLWSEGSGDVAFVDCATGLQRASVNVGGTIRAEALDPAGANVVIAAGRSLILVDTSSATIIKRALAQLSVDRDLALFWFQAKP